MTVLQFDSSQLMDMNHMWVGIYNRLECIETWDTNQSHPVRDFRELPCTDFRDHKDLHCLAVSWFHPCTRNIQKSEIAEYMVYT